MFRDDRGRTRFDYDLEPGHTVRMIDDVERSTFILLDMSRRVFETDSYSSPVQGWQYKPIQLEYTQDTRSIHGVECVRVKVHSSKASEVSKDLGEVWLSELLGLVLKDENPSEGWSWEITLIDFRAPGADAFVVPPGFMEASEAQ